MDAAAAVWRFDGDTERIQERLRAPSAKRQEVTTLVGKKVAA